MSQTSATVFPHAAPAEGAATAWLHRCDPAVTMPAPASAPLQGLRFAVKDNIDVAGVPTTAACPAFARTAERHATVVQRLLQAGAQLVGKTNLDQFACGLNGTRSPLGAVPNAVHMSYVSGGSSSGSGHVVACGAVDFALGTDTAGSGRVPAGLQNIVGLKPSKGLLSAFGVLPAAQSVDCVSIFARTVEQAFQVLAAGMGHDAQDPYSRSLVLQGTAWQPGFRFGVPDVLEFFGDSQTEAAYAQAVARLQALGGVPVTIAYAPLAEAAAMLYESPLVAERYTAIRDFYDAQPEAVVEPVRSIIGAGRAYDAAALFAAQTRLKALEQQARPMWDQVDLLLLPTAPTHYTVAAMQADPVQLNRNLGHYTNFVNLLDYAALSVPSALRPDGLPFGITLVGPCASDWQLAELGHRYQHQQPLPLGATQEVLPAYQPLPVPPGAVGAAEVDVVVVGAHLSGMPLNHQLSQRAARLVQATQTAPLYRLVALAGTVPPKPGLLHVAAGEAGTAIAVEVWRMPQALYGSFVGEVPAPLCIGRVQLADGRALQGFLCEAWAAAGATDISAHGGWKAYLASLAPQPVQPAPAAA